MIDDLIARLDAAGFTGVTPAQHTVFENLGPGGTRLTELAARAGITHQSMSELVSVLEQRGYLDGARPQRPAPGSSASPPQAGRWSAGPSRNWPRSRVNGARGSPSRPQAVIATPDPVPDMVTSIRAFAGGRPLSSAATLSRSRCVSARKSALRGKYWRNSPLPVLVAAPLPRRVRVAEAGRHSVGACIGLPQKGPAPVRLIVERSGISLNVPRDLVLAELGAT